MLVSKEYKEIWCKIGRHRRSISNMKSQFPRSGEEMNISPLYQFWPEQYGKHTTAWNGYPYSTRDSLYRTRLGDTNTSSIKM